MEPIIVIFLFAFALVISVGVLIRSFLSRHILGTLKIDNSGNTFKCRFEFDDLDALEGLGFAIVKIKEEDLRLPGEKPQD